MRLQEANYDDIDRYTHINTFITRPLVSYNHMNETHAPARDKMH